MKCPYCGEEGHVIKRGVRQNKYVMKQKYYCKNCQRVFVERDGFEHMTYPKEIILKTLHLYAEGLSLSKIRDFIWQHEGYYLHDSVILYWVKKYANILEEFEKKLKPEIKGRIHMDEVVLKEKGRKIYDINAVDGKTGYNLGHVLTDSLSIPAFRVFFEELKRRIYDQCLERYKKYTRTGKDKRITFVSDKREHYKNAFNKYFYRVCKLAHGVPIACKKYGLKFNNNPIERYNEDVKQRYKVMRGFKSIESANAFLGLRRIIYNFVRGDETRAMKAGIALELGQNRLLTLIKIWEKTDYMF